MTGAGTGAGAGIGTAAEEAARLFEAVQEWAQRSAGTLASGPLGEQVATGAPECRLCPVCQLISLLRDTRPEVVLHLAEAASALLAALRAAIAAHEAEWSARGPSDVERIHIG